MIKLHLLQDIQYHSILASDGIQECYEKILASIHAIPDGTELCLVVDYHCHDAVELSLRLCAQRFPPTKEDKEAVDSLSPLPSLPSPPFCIPKGEYGFEQLAFFPEPAQLFSTLLRLCTSSSGTIYFRILKENPVEIVFQLLFQL